jgi:serine phosphatase RsbU (regulator of sigma subunit)
VGDVAGHDLKAAYLSAYFQGLLRGLLTSGMQPEEILTFMNLILLEEMGRFESGPASLGVGVALLDVGAHTMRTLSAGIPVCTAIGSSGRPSRIGEAGQPLGWFRDDYLAQSRAVRS